MVQGGPFRNHSHQTSWSKVVHFVITVIRRQGPRWFTSVVTVIIRHGPTWSTQQSFSSDSMFQGGPLRNYNHHTSRSKVVHSVIIAIRRHGPGWSIHSVITVIRLPGPRWSTSVDTVIIRHGPTWSTQQSFSSDVMVQGGPPS